MSQRRVLVVDDDQTVLFLVTKLLKGAGYAVGTAQDANQAVMQAHREVPHLIVTDMMMPAGGGMTVLERLLMSSKTNTIPILVLTASDDPEVKARAMQAGAAQVLHKPLDAAVLLASVRAAIDQSTDPPAPGGGNP